MFRVRASRSRSAPAEADDERCQIWPFASLLYGCGNGEVPASPAPPPAAVGLICGKQRQKCIIRGAQQHSAFKCVPASGGVARCRVAATAAWPSLASLTALTALLRCAAATKSDTWASRSSAAAVLASLLPAVLPLPAAGAALNKRHRYHWSCAIKDQMLSDI